MSNRLSTAGMSLQYAVETTKGTRPTSGYKVIPEVKTMPSLSPAPNTIESTTLAETECTTYVKGLKDMGGALEYRANLTEDLITFWDTLMSEYEAAEQEDKAMWFAVVHPKLTKATYYKGEPAPLGLNDVDVGGMAETTLYITPNSPVIMEVKPTDV